eukprot:gnl/MRDRNA2_/MRDRNA2_43066_c0_seq2.p1 gnl/MRDRNA2_/MRDRNA2_43066_c0~~gnl/MRDRNA2_/MRDRNA2_43066_c0_seq2.p1  ORF type:complete len:175 (+),score=28.81 gnl/MRDRNA2_/MRDRNA2_43066_c0_seq2:40-525(+)
MIAPLTHVKAEDGPTEFRLRSHKVRTKPEDIRNLPLSSLELRPGDAVLFDGRIVHRGGPRAKTAGARDVIYAVHSKWWYNEDDIGGAEYGLTTVPLVPDAEVNKMYVEEPWLKPEKTGVARHLLSEASLALGHPSPAGILLGGCFGCIFGYTWAGTKVLPA